MKDLNEVATSQTFNLCLPYSETSIKGRYAYKISCDC